MTAICADEGLKLGPAIRHSLMHRTSTPPKSVTDSAWMQRAMHELRQVESLVYDRWDSLEANDKAFLRRLSLGTPISLSFPERLDAIWWFTSTLLTMAIRREEALKYFSAVDELIKKVNERVAEEAWKRILSDKDFVAAAERGKQSKAAGKAIPYFSSK